MKLNLLLEFNKEKCNLKSQIYNIKKAMTKTSTNTHLDVFI